MTAKTKTPKVAPAAAQELKVLAAKLPPAMLRQIDRSAKKAGRNRSQEVRLRLQHSLQTYPQLLSVAAA